MENAQLGTNKKYILTSLMYAYIISISFLNVLIGAAFERGGMVINIAIVLGIAALNIREVTRIRVKPIVIIYIMLIVGAFLLTKTVSRTRISSNEFYFYFTLGSFFAALKCDYERVLRYIMYISLLAIPFHNDLLGELMKFDSKNIVGMGTAFAIMPVFMAGIIHYFFFRRKGKLFDEICYIVDFFFLFELVMKGNRGIALAVLVTIFSLYIKRWGRGGNRRISSRLIVVMLAAFLIYINFFAILEWLDEVLKSFDIDAYFIKKIMNLEESGDVMNGREYIFEYTIENIIKSPFYGHGISTILYNSGGRIPYPHNFVLQLMYDGGLFLAIPILNILFNAIKAAFTDENRIYAAFLLYMLLICVPKMLFSTDLWENVAFWLLIAHSLQNSKNKAFKKSPEEENDESIQKIA